MKKNKKMILLVILLLFMVFATAQGTIAWLTRTSKITNTFTVGTFELPTTNPNNPNETITLEGNLYEPSWDATEEHKFVPGITITKDPFVGIGKGSEDAVVYVYVENNFSNKIYFTLNAGWEAVEAESGYAQDTYTSGLFKYTDGLVGSTTDDVWTSTPLFSEVVADETANIVDFTVAEGEKLEITVSSFIHQAKDSSGNAIDAATIEAAAKQAFGI